MTLEVTTPSGRWVLTTSAPFPFGLRFGWATTFRRTTRFSPRICPDVRSLMHEYWHVEHTNVLRYGASITIGRLWGSTYWRDQERGANAAALADPPSHMLVVAARLRAAIPAHIPTVTITNSHG